MLKKLKTNNIPLLDYGYKHDMSIEPVFSTVYQVCSAGRIYYVEDQDADKILDSSPGQFVEVFDIADDCYVDLNRDHVEAIITARCVTASYIKGHETVSERFVTPDTTSLLSREPIYSTYIKL